MLYRKITIACKGAEKRLNRVLQVRTDVDVLTLGYIILSSLEAEFTSPYAIEAQDACYVFDSALEQDYMPYTGTKEWRSLRDYHFTDLTSQFCVKYFDNEEPDMEWEFECKADKKTSRLASDLYAFLMDGTGMGLWEEQKKNYFDYLAGKIDPNDAYAYTDNDVWIPSNLNIETFGETDSAFDLEIAKEDFEADMYPEYVNERTKFIEAYIYDDDDDEEDAEWNDDIWDDEEDFLDYLDDTDEDSITRGAMAMVMTAAMQHIDNIDFVREKFDELSEIYGVEGATLKIFEAVAECFKMFVQGDLMKNNKEYRKKIKSLK